MNGTASPHVGAVIGMARQRRGFAGHVLINLIGNHAGAHVHVIDRVERQLQRRTLGRADEDVVAEIGLGEEVLAFALQDR